MKNTILGLLAATLVATPALAGWQTELFNRLDVDANGLLTVAELETTGCKVNKKFFAYANKDGKAGLSKAEFLQNRDLFKRCK